MKICGPFNIQCIVDWNQEAKPNKKNLLLGTQVDSRLEIQNVATWLQIALSDCKKRIEKQLKGKFVTQCTFELFLVRQKQVNLSLTNSQWGVSSSVNNQNS